MTYETPRTDQQVLDEILDDVLARLEDGDTVDLEALVGGRTHLRHHIEDVVRLAQSVAVSRGDATFDVAGYTILSELGAGGMGTVYLARQERLGGRPVALKVLPSSVAVSPRARRRFLAEAKAIAKLRHPNVVAIHDVVNDAHACAYAMEWIQGGTLADVIKHIQAVEDRSGVPDVSTLLGAPASRPVTAGVIDICRLGLAVARALQSVHDAGLVHRDVKPSNILIRSDGTPLLSDFGLVRETDTTVHTQAGSFVGTAAYASPEQLRGETSAVDARSDVYSLGVTLYHALTRRLPFDGRSVGAILQHMETGAAPRLRKIDVRLPRDLETIVGKALEPEPARRYQTARDLALDLERLLELRPIVARPASMVARTIKLARRNRANLVGASVSAAIVLTLAVAAALFVLWLPHQIEASIRDGRLALLDPGQGDRIFASVLEMPDHLRPQLDPAERRRIVARYEEAIEAYGRWPRFLYPREARLEMMTVALARELSVDPPIAANGVRPALAREAPLTTRYAAGRSVPAPASLSDDDLDDATSSDLRCLGLLAYLCHDAQTSLAAWTRLDLVRQPDPLVEASLGQLYLSLEQCELAYIYAASAFRRFDDVAFLCHNVADAAIQLGQLRGDAAMLERGRQLLVDARTMEHGDELFTSERIWADYYAATGQDDEAETRYRFFATRRQAPTARDHFARFRIARGRLREAMQIYADLLRLRGWVHEYRRRFVDTADRWWASQSVPQRQRLMGGALEGGRLLRDMRLYEESYVMVGPQKPAISELPSTRGAPDSASFLQTADLFAVAQRMEVTNMELWCEFRDYPRIFRRLQLAAWQIEDGGSLSQVVPRVHRGLLRTSVGRWALALVAALGANTAATAQLGNVVQVTGDSYLDRDVVIAFSDIGPTGVLVWSRQFDVPGCIDQDQYFIQWNGTDWTSAALVPHQTSLARHTRHSIDFWPGLDRCILTFNTNFTSNICADELGSRQWNAEDGWDTGPTDMTTTDGEDDRSTSVRVAHDGSYALAIWSDDTGANHSYAIDGSVWTQAAGWGPTIEIVPFLGVDNEARKDRGLAQDPISGTWLAAYRKGAPVSTGEVACVAGTATESGLSFGAEISLSDDTVGDGWPIVRFNETGDGAVFWTKNVDGLDGELVVALWDRDSETFSSPVQLTDDDQEDLLQSVVGGDGGWHLIFRRIVSGESDTELFYGWFDGASLLYPTRLTTNEHLIADAQAAVDASGALHVAWIDQLGADSAQRELYVGQLIPLCPWDLDGDGEVGVSDLLEVLAAWGTDAFGPPDLDGDGLVGVGDLLVLLARWGTCS